MTGRTVAYAARIRARPTLARSRGRTGSALKLVERDDQSGEANPPGAIRRELGQVEHGPDPWRQRKDVGDDRPALRFFGHGQPRARNAFDATEEPRNGSPIAARGRAKARHRFATRALPLDTHSRVITGSVSFTAFWPVSWRGPLTPCLRTGFGSPSRWEPWSLPSASITGIACVPRWGSREAEREESMLSKHDPWFAFDPPVDESTDLLTLPEIKRELAHASPGEDDLGLRSLFEHPEVLSRSLWTEGLAPGRRHGHAHHRRPVHHVPHAP